MLMSLEETVAVLNGLLSLERQMNVKELQKCKKENQALKNINATLNKVIQSKINENKKLRGDKGCECGCEKEKDIQFELKEWQVPCSWCGSKKGVPCKNKKGKTYFRDVHLTRYRKYWSCACDGLS